MISLLLAMDQLGADDVPDAVRDEHGRGHEALLRLACDVTRAEGDGDTDDWAEETNQRVSGDRSSGFISPAGFPDHHEACDYRETAED